MGSDGGLATQKRKPGATTLLNQVANIYIYIYIYIYIILLGKQSNSLVNNQTGFKVLMTHVKNKVLKYLSLSFNKKKLNMRIFYSTNQGAIYLRATICLNLWIFIKGK
jgi:hypothetical protein